MNKHKPKEVKLKDYVGKDKVLAELEWAFIEEFIALRKNHNLTQQQMADKSGVLREQIAIVENMLASPQLNTLIKMLEPLGYTVTIEKIKK